MSAALSRRALFGGAGKLAAVAALAAAPAVASAALASHPDAEIIAGLHRWCAAVRVYIASPLDGENEQWVALLDAAADAMTATVAIPARTIDGLAIKAFLAQRHEFGGTGANEMMPDYESSIMTDNTIPTVLGADLLRLSPILADAVA